ncbi:hypothetical protein [Aliiroseovarius sp. YM-037]|uniref:hypothetical protein n=1 Tax=Aliiroseovarius sp. YM-037 TaxID=3341728 RepID=UPI003A80288D
MTNPEWMDDPLAAEGDLPELAALAEAELEELGAPDGGAPAMDEFDDIDDLPEPPEPDMPDMPEPPLPDDPDTPDDGLGGDLGDDFDDLIDDPDSDIAAALEDIDPDVDMLGGLEEDDLDEPGEPDMIDIDLPEPPDIDEPELELDLGGATDIDGELPDLPNQSDPLSADLRSSSEVGRDGTRTIRVTTTLELPDRDA